MKGNISSSMLLLITGVLFNLATGCEIKMSHLILLPTLKALPIKLYVLETRSGWLKT